MEDNGIVLDFLARGKSSSFKSEPLAQLLGTTSFTLLEVVPREGVTLQIGEKVYIGRNERSQISHIKKRIEFPELTSTAFNELPNAITQVINADPAKFLAFFNKSRPISLRLHQMQLLPGVGPKHVQELLLEREKGDFMSFDQLSDRVPFLPDPVQILVKRVLEELKGTDQKYYLFVRPPTEPGEARRR
ncbi:MAG: DUF655 domain-containing protein [Candidatus Diapherotrites archaeon]|nr:DUF655 domain-containing protein [Candidatus Diapherotrites archaeon]